MSRRLDVEEIDRQLGDLPGWSGGPDALSREASFPDFPAAIRAVDEIAVVAEAMDHHPDIDIRWRTLRITVSTHSAGGVTQLDIELAYRVDEAVAHHGGQ